MKRLIALILVCAALSAVAADPVFEVATLASPAGPGANGPSLASGPEGKVYLSWLEPAGNGETALKFSTFDVRARRWSPSRTIAQARDLLVNRADFPSLAAQAGGRITAVWPVANPMTNEADAHHTHDSHPGAGQRAFVSQSTDGGATWSAPQPLSRESEAVEFASLRPLADGSVLAAWLDGRGKKSPPGGETGTMQLYARLIGSQEPDRLVDASVCDCCPTSLASFPDGSALLSYRGRTTEDIRDILDARFIDGNWEKSRASPRDGWKIAGCPVNGPRIVSDGPRVAKAWFTAAEGSRVFASISPDAGGLYTQPARVDLGHPVGRVDTLLLRDGTQFVTWLEQAAPDGSATAGLFLRRYGPNGATQPPVLIAALSDLHGAGTPRLALVKDFDATPAQLVATFTRAGEPSRVETVLITLPEASVLAEADSHCACEPRGDELRGYGLRGRVIAAPDGSDVLRVRHGAVPGVLRAGERDFKVAPNVRAAVKADREVFARIEQREGEWWMFDVRLLAEPRP